MAGLVKIGSKRGTYRSPLVFSAFGMNRQDAVHVRTGVETPTTRRPSTQKRGTSSAKGVGK